MKDQKPKRHPLVSLAFILAFYIFVFPTYANLMVTASFKRNMISAILATLGCYTTVLIPLILGNFLTNRNPSKWSKSKLVRATWVILIIGFVFGIINFLSHLKITN